VGDALYAGLRRGELTALHREDLDLATGVIRVVRGWDQEEGEIAPKSKQGRRKVPIPAVLRDRLDEHLLDAPASGRISSACATATTAVVLPPRPPRSSRRRCTSAATATRR
jgi:integrase